MGYMGLYIVSICISATLDGFNYHVLTHYEPYEEEAVQTTVHDSKIQR